MLTVSDPYPAVSLPPPVHSLGQKKMPGTMISSFVLLSVSDFFKKLFREEDKHLLDLYSKEMQILASQWTPSSSPRNPFTTLRSSGF